MKPDIVLAISGASGAIYGVTLLEFLLNAQYRVYLVLSRSARLIIRQELQRDWGLSFSETRDILKEAYPGDNLHYCDETDMTAPIASGSVLTGGMIIAPCSMKTLAGIANGFSSTLIERAADVCLKEKRRLILIPRETPLHSIHLQNMLTLSQMGATVLPAMPAFYNQPDSIQDLVNFVVSRALDHLGIENKLSLRWREE